MKTVQYGEDRLPGHSWATGHCAADEPIDPLDVKYDGISLRALLQSDERCRREVNPRHNILTPAQRAVVSAHWSAELRARVGAVAEKQKNQVMMEYDE